MIAHSKKPSARGSRPSVLVGSPLAGEIARSAGQQNASHSKSHGPLSRASFLSNRFAHMIASTEMELSFTAYQERQLHEISPAGIAARA